MSAVLQMVDGTARTPDRQLVARCLGGEPDQFRDLIRRYERVVIAHLRTRLRDRDAIDDAAQETFVRAYQNLDRLRSPDAFFSWLVGIADRVARESGRHLARERRVLAAFAAEPRPAPTSPSSHHRDAELETALGSLSHPLRDVVLLRFYGEQSCTEIAATLAIPVSTVTKRLSRAYDLLRRRMKPGGL